MRCHPMISKTLSSQKNKKDCQAIEPAIPFLERPRDSRAVQSDQSKLDVAVSRPPSLREVMLTRNELPTVLNWGCPGFPPTDSRMGPVEFEVKAETRL